MRLSGTDRDLRDFTRWNRHGLHEITYTQAGPIEIFQALRLSHMLLYAKSGANEDSSYFDPELWHQALEQGSFEDGQSIEDALREIASRFTVDFVAPKDSLSYAERMKAEFVANSTDPITNISKAFAMALGGLLETLDVYANESLLATSKDERAIADMLALTGYTTRPASSAQVPIALMLKPEAGRARIPRYIAAEYAHPSDQILHFESLEILEADAELNLIRPKDWDQRIVPILQSDVKFKLTTNSPFSNDLNNELVVLLGDGTQTAARITASSASSRTISVSRSSIDPFAGRMRDTSILMAPKLNLQTRPRGESWINFSGEPNCYMREVIYCTGEMGGKLARVLEIRGRDVRIGPYFEFAFEPSPFAGFASFAASPIIGNIIAAHKTRRGIVVVDGSTEDETLFTFGNYEKIDDQPLGDVVQLNASRIYVDDEKCAEIEGTVWGAFDRGGRQIFASQLTPVSRDALGCEFSLTNRHGSAAGIQRFSTGWAQTAQLEHDVRSNEPLAQNDGSIALERQMSDLLGIGRKIIIATDPELASTQAPQAFCGKIREVDQNHAGETRIKTDIPIEHLSSLACGDVVLYGNVVDFGHGLTMPPIILGNGDSAIEAQSFVIEHDQISTRPNAEFPGGVAYDVELTVDNRKWRQIADEGVGPSDQPSYLMTRMIGGEVELTCLQSTTTGTENVVLSKIRKGSGRIGNDVTPFGLTNLAKAVAEIDKIIQPLSPQFGADAQSADELRKEGGGMLYGRVVSVKDFALIARNHAAVQDAQAVLTRKSSALYQSLVKLTLIPVGGGDILAIKDELRDTILKRAAPGTQIAISSYLAATISIKAQINLSAGYTDYGEIRDEISQSLLADFSLAGRNLGDRLYKSQISVLIESHPAVASVNLTLAYSGDDEFVRINRAGDGSILAIRPVFGAVVFVPDASALDLTVGA